MTALNEDRIKKIAEAFTGRDSDPVCVPFGNGHINDTFRVTINAPEAPLQERIFVLQKINSTVFRNPVQVMENVLGVTGWIRLRLEDAGLDPERRVLDVIRTLDGQPCYVDEDGECWRAYRFIRDAVCYERAETEDIFYQSAVAFGNFQHLLSDYPAQSLYETIPDFHNTPVRLRQFLDTVERDPVGRAESAAEEIGFLRSRGDLAGRLTQAAAAGHLPLRVTHNDTKLNNVMIDRETGKWLCVIDLDTVMSGLSVTDFGDAIRFGASTAAEDEPDLDKVHFDRHLYEVYRQGYIEGCQGALTDSELQMLPDGAMVITYEQALRFLADYLNGDVYYKTARPAHNLERARTQIRLLSEMEQLL